MKIKKYIILIISILVSIILVVGGYQIFKYYVKIDQENEVLAKEFEKQQKAQRELEKNSNFYEKLERGFDVKILLVGNSMALSEGSSSDEKWPDILKDKLEEKYNVNVLYENMGSAYSDYGAGYVQLATLEDNIDYDAVITCYPATQDENKLIQYEAILRTIKNKYDNCAIISVLANSDQQEDPTKVCEMIQLYGAVSVDMQKIINDNGDSVIDHDFYPNDLGYQLYADYVFGTIESGVANNIPSNVNNIDPIYEQVLDYNNCVFVPLRKCRKQNDNTFIIDLSSFQGKICMKARFAKGKKAYDIYYDNGNWITRNEMNYSEDCWYDTFLFHDIPNVQKKLIFSLSGDVTMDEIEGVYLISEDSIVLKDS